MAATVFRRTTPILQYEQQAPPCRPHKAHSLTSRAYLQAWDFFAAILLRTGPRDHQNDSRQHVQHLHVRPFGVNFWDTVQVNTAAPHPDLRGILADAVQQAVRLDDYDQIEGLEAGIVTPRRARELQNIATTRAGGLDAPARY